MTVFFFFFFLLLTTRLPSGGSELDAARIIQPIIIFTVILALVVGSPSSPVPELCTTVYSPSEFPEAVVTVSGESVIFNVNAKCDERKDEQRDNLQGFFRSLQATQSENALESTCDQASEEGSEVGYDMNPARHGEALPSGAVTAAAPAGCRNFGTRFPGASAAAAADRAPKR
mmetsp:Transcript_25598/g.45460  ORF Transcript_25598/g.45460 Transcript_25598/m.45460 type:complete len:173 (-) Transcript_25598:95-613(-)